MKNVKLIISIFFLNCGLSSVAFGCRYTVREIGFTDIAPTPYYLYFYAQHDTPQELISAFKRISYAALSDANVEVEIIHINEQQNHPAMEYFRFWKVDSLPATILIAPEKQSMVLPLSIKNQTFKQAIWTIIEKIVTSPTRDKILADIVTSYCVVLLIEGKESSTNKTARTEVDRAIKRIDKMMDLMPKPVDEPPQLIEIPAKLAASEKLLLWSLGRNDEDMNEPTVAVIYGRGRRMGPLLKGEQIKENWIFNLLSIVGADCECGLDRSWMLGTMIPLRWSSKIQAQIVKHLGFDVENPMVKSEMRRIISMGIYTGAQDQGPDNVIDGYSENVVEFETNSDIPRVTSSQIQEMQTTESSSALKIALFIIGGIFVLVFATGLFILIRAYLADHKR